MTPELLFSPGDLVCVSNENNENYGLLLVVRSFLFRAEDLIGKVSCSHICHSPRYLFWMAGTPRTGRKVRGSETSGSDSRINIPPDDLTVFGRNAMRGYFFCGDKVITTKLLEGDGLPLPASLERGMNMGIVGKRTREDGTEYFAADPGGGHGGGYYEIQMEPDREIAYVRNWQTWLLPPEPMRPFRVGDLVHPAVRHEEGQLGVVQKIELSSGRVHVKAYGHPLRVFHAGDLVHRKLSREESSGVESYDDEIDVPQLLTYSIDG